MRPLYLSVSGLSCFRDPQDIDFASLQRFAIAGPIGSGKSTLLDAMIFALYGDIPRVNSHQRSELISSGCERMQVRLDFALGETRYRIARVLRRNGVQRVRLEELREQGEALSLVDQVRGANAYVTQLLGLDAQAFMQAVVIPQGEFARFLNAAPRERRTMLRTLLGLEIYEHMRKRAQSKVDADKAGLQSLGQLLEHEYAGVDQEALSQLAEQQAQAKAELTRLRQGRDDLHAKLAEQREQGALSAELFALEQELDALGNQHEDMQQLRHTIARAKRATALRGLVEQCSRAEAHAMQAQAILNQTQTRCTQAQQRHAEAKQHMQNVEPKSGINLALAQHLRHELVAGEPCPVCQQHVPSEILPHAQSQPSPAPRNAEVQAWQQAQQILEGRAAESIAAEEALRLHRETATQAQQEAEALRQQCDAALIEAGFADGDTLQTALQDEPTLAEEEQALQQYDQERHHLEQQRLKLVAQLGDTPAPTQLLEQTEAEANALNAQVETQQGQLSALTQQHRSMQERLTRALQLQAEKAQAQATLSSAQAGANHTHPRESSAQATRKLLHRTLRLPTRDGKSRTEGHMLRFPILKHLYTLKMLHSRVCEANSKLCEAPARVCEALFTLREAFWRMRRTSWRMGEKIKASLIFRAR